MHCPECGTLMNRHAEKAIKDSHAPETEVIASIHYCPRCGKVEAEFEPKDR
jgi:ribosomal protein S27AE